MSPKILFAALALAATGPTFAASLGDFGPVERLSMRHRADVLAELRTAMHDGSMAHGGPSDAPAPVSTASRSEVSAEAREALRTGEIEVNDAEVHAGMAAPANTH